MITQPPQQRRGRAAVLVLGVALVGVVALATIACRPVRPLLRFRSVECRQPAQLPRSYVRTVSRAVLQLQ